MGHDQRNAFSVAGNAQTVGDRIRFARYALPREHKTRPVSQLKIGVACCWASPQTQLYRLENNHRSPTVDECKKLANALNVAPEWLAFGVGDGPHRDDLGAGNDAVRVDRFSPPGFRDPGGESVGFDLGGAR